MNAAHDIPSSADAEAAEALALARGLAFCREVLAPQAAAFDAAEALSTTFIAAMAGQGLFGAAIAQEYGGFGLRARAFGELCAAFGHASASALSLMTVHSMVAVALTRWGKAEQKQCWLPELASGKTIGAFALSEPNAGSNANDVETRLQLDGDTIYIDGCKTWISFGELAGVFLVVGKLDGRLSAVLVDRSTPGLQITPIRGMFGFRAGMLAELRFTHCAVPRTQLFGSSDFGLSQIVGSVLDHGRYCIAWGSTGLAQACLEASTAYAEQRMQFGQRLQEFQLVQEMLADLMVESRAARLLCIDAAAARTARSPDLIVRTTAAKYYAARVADRAAAAALQIHGANGCSDRYPVQRYLRDAKIMNIIEGSTQIQQVLMAQHSVQWAQGLKELL